MMKKFYVGHKRMAEENSWAKETEAEAIAHAKEICAKTGERQIVVKVIAVIERQAPPMKVTRVR
jgi:hypothetical protein